MNIKVLKCINHYEVEISTSIGNAICFCKERNLFEGMICGVEMDILSTINLDKNAQKVEMDKYFIKHDNNFNKIQGLVEDIDEDNLICFRLSSDLIIVVECDDERIKVGDYLLLNIYQKDLIITLIGL